MLRSELVLKLQKKYPSLNINDIEWEPLQTIVATRYIKFLEQHMHEAKEFFYLGETEEEIKGEIDKIVYMYGKDPTDDLNKLHVRFVVSFNTKFNMFMLKYKLFMAYK